MSRRAAIYARQSEDRTGEEAGVARQVADCTDLIAGKGWDLTGTYVDNDISASSGKVRPEFERLLTDATAGRLDVVVCWAPDRLVRKVVELERILPLVELHGVDLHHLHGGELDLTSAHGRMVARILGSIAQGEVEVKATRQRRANRQRAEAGTVGWTRRPYGFDKVDGRVVVLEGEAEEIRAAAKRVLEGDTLTSVVRDLNARGVGTSTGARWTVTTLRRVLLNPRCAGRATYHCAHVGVGDWAAILDEDTHRQLVAVLTDPRRKTAPTTESKYLLSGLVRCGICGGPMFACPTGRKGRRWMIYRCRVPHLARRLDLVDDLVTAVVLRRLGKPDAASLFARDEVDIDALVEESVRVREKLDELAGLLVEGVLTAAGVREESARLRKRLGELERERVAAARDSGVVPLVSADDVGATWLAMPLRERRAVVDLLVEVTVLPAGKGGRFKAEDVRIEWRTE